MPLGAFRPAMPGCAIETPGKPYGTLGCIVRDLPPYTGMYVLSAAHVIANHTFDPLGLPVLQSGEVIAVVTRWGELVFTTDGYPNLFDAAIARAEPSAVTAEAFEIGRMRGTNQVVARDDKVIMIGATSGRVDGVVLNPNFHCEFTYTDPDGNDHRAGFQQQILCGPPLAFAKGGDSGSVVVDASNRVVGLVVGIVPDGTVVSPIGPMLSSLKVRLA